MSWTTNQIIGTVLTVFLSGGGFGVGTYALWDKKKKSKIQCLLEKVASGTATPVEHKTALSAIAEGGQEGCKLIREIKMKLIAENKAAAGQRMEQFEEELERVPTVRQTGERTLPMYRLQNIPIANSVKEVAYSDISSDAVPAPPHRRKCACATCQRAENAS